MVHKGNLPVGDPRLSYSSKVGSPEHAAGVKENLCDFFFSIFPLMLSSLIRMGTCHGATGYHGVARIVCQLVGATLKMPVATR